MGGCGGVIRQLGLENEVVERDHPWDAEFCSALFYPVLDVNGAPTFVLGQKPGRFLTKFPWSLDLGVRCPRAELRSKALGQVRAVMYNPILRPYLDRVIGLTQDVCADAVYDKYSASHTTEVFTCSASTLDFVRRRYGASEDILLDWSQFCGRLRAGHFDTHPLVDLLVDRDA